MAHLLLFGKLSCTESAKAERILDTLQTLLPSFEVHKELLEDEEWDNRVNTYLKSQGIDPNKRFSSPLIFRELIERGGKSCLVGGLSELLQYAHHYYGIELDDKLDFENIRDDTQRQEKFKKESLNRYLASIPQDFVICLLPGIDSDYLYFLMNFLVDESIFGSRLRSIYILSDSHQLETHQGWALELCDMSSPYVRKVECLDSHSGALQSADFIFWHPNKVSQKYIESLQTEILRPLEENKKDFRCLISGENSFELLVYLREKLQPADFSNKFISTGLSVEMKVKSILARKLNVNSFYISEVIVLGDPWGEFAKDFSVIIKQAKVQTYQGGLRGPVWFKLDSSDVIYEKDWDTTTFIDLLNESLKHDRPGYIIASSLAKQAKLMLTDGNERVTEEELVASVVLYQEDGLESFQDLKIPFCAPIIYPNRKPLEFEMNENEVNLLNEIKERLNARKSALLSLL